ncbi:hypothetical protein [Aeromonas veronii]|uniref:hypothetical protein n=1 Tax=Aeromonas veronii TaxID=654 RepID=UPI003F746538
MDEKISFIMSAINDAQATIRATDVKVGALLAGLLLPISYIGAIWDYALSDYTPRLLFIMICILFILWATSISILVKTISAVGNPAKNISGEEYSNGSFYGGELYKFTFKNALLNLNANKSSMSVQLFCNTYPSSQVDICLALSFEHMKLIYIRDIKLYRLDLALKTTVVFLLLGIETYILSKII